jgi:hypothetical protein
LLIETEEYYAISLSVRTPEKFWNVVTEKISWTDRVRNEVLKRVRAKRKILQIIKRRKVK